MKTTNTSVDYIALNIQDWIMSPCTSIFGDCMSEGNRMRAHDIDSKDLWQVCDEVVKMTWDALRALERDS